MSAWMLQRRARAWPGRGKARTQVRLIKGKRVVFMAHRLCAVGSTDDGRTSLGEESAGRPDAAAAGVQVFIRHRHRSDDSVIGAATRVTVHFSQVGNQTSATGDP